MNKPTLPRTETNNCTTCKYYDQIRQYCVVTGNSADKRYICSMYKPK